MVRQKPQEFGYGVMSPGASPVDIFAPTAQKGPKIIQAKATASAANRVAQSLGVLASQNEKVDTESLPNLANFVYDLQQQGKSQEYIDKAVASSGLTTSRVLSSIERAGGVDNLTNPAYRIRMQQLQSRGAELEIEKVLKGKEKFYTDQLKEMPADADPEVWMANLAFSVDSDVDAIMKTLDPLSQATIRPEVAAYVSNYSRKIEDEARAFRDVRMGELTGAQVGRTFARAIADPRLLPDFSKIASGDLRDTMNSVQPEAREGVLIQTLKQYDAKISKAVNTPGGIDLNSEGGRDEVVALIDAIEESFSTPKGSLLEEYGRAADQMRALRARYVANDRQIKEIENHSNFAGITRQNALGRLKANTDTRFNDPNAQANAARWMEWAEGQLANPEDRDLEEYQSKYGLSEDQVESFLVAGLEQMEGVFKEQLAFSETQNAQSLRQQNQSRIEQERSNAIEVNRAMEMAVREPNTDRRIEFLNPYIESLPPGSEARAKLVNYQRSLMENPRYGSLATQALESVESQMQVEAGILKQTDPLEGPVSLVPAGGILTSNYQGVMDRVRRMAVAEYVATSAKDEQQAEEINLERLQGIYRKKLNEQLDITKNAAEATALKPLVKVPPGVSPADIAKAKSEGTLQELLPELAFVVQEDNALSTAILETLGNVSSGIDFRMPLSNQITADGGLFQKPRKEVFEFYEDIADVAERLESSGATPQQKRAVITALVSNSQMLSVRDSLDGISPSQVLEDNLRGMDAALVAGADVEKMEQNLGTRALYAFDRKLMIEEKEFPAASSPLLRAQLNQLKTARSKADRARRAVAVLEQYGTSPAKTVDALGSRRYRDLVDPSVHPLQRLIRSTPDGGYEFNHYTEDRPGGLDAVAFNTGMHEMRRFIANEVLSKAGPEDVTDAEVLTVLARQREILPLQTR